jgi:ubiquitin C-terminal hydrolase
VQTESKIRMSDCLNLYLENRSQKITRISPILVLCCHNITKSNMNKQLHFEPVIPIYENHQSKDYLCTGLVYHHGGLYGGHYTSIVLSPDKRWYHCDDGRVEHCQQLPSNLPSLLFYQQI